MIHSLKSTKEVMPKLLYDKAMGASSKNAVRSKDLENTNHYPVKLLRGVDYNGSVGKVESINRDTGRLNVEVFGSGKFYFAKSGGLACYLPPEDPSVFHVVRDEQTGDEVLQILSKADHRFPDTSVVLQKPLMKSTIAVKPENVKVIVENVDVEALRKKILLAEDMIGTRPAATPTPADPSEVHNDEHDRDNSSQHKDLKKSQDIGEKQIPMNKKNAGGQVIDEFGWWRDIVLCPYCKARHGRNVPCDNEKKTGRDSLTVPKNGPPHRLKLELITWNGLDGSPGGSTILGWGGFEGRRADKMKREFQRTYQCDEVKFSADHPDAFRWTCCGMLLSQGSSGCDHHGRYKEWGACQCDFCRGGVELPKWNQRVTQGNTGIPMVWGPDPRSVSSEGKVNLQMRENFFKTMGGGQSCEQQ